MMTGSNQAGVPSRAVAAAAVATLALTTMVSACSSGGHTTASGASVTVAQPTCQQVGDVLSNGPDPDADPVGYAEAQIQPLQRIHAKDPALAQAITTLAGAYSSFYAANGTGAAKSVLSAAIKRINSLCPDAGAAA